jgi:hypothetical protein
MIPPFDIFKRLGGGGVRWLGMVTDLEAAKVRVKELVASSPGEYFIFSLAAGHRLHIKPDGPDANSTSIGTASLMVQTQTPRQSERPASEMPTKVPMLNIGLICNPRNDAAVVVTPLNGCAQLHKSLC